MPDSYKFYKRKWALIIVFTMLCNTNVTDCKMRHPLSSRNWNSLLWEVILIALVIVNWIVRGVSWLPKHEYIMDVWRMLPPVVQDGIWTSCMPPVVLLCEQWIWQSNIIGVSGGFITVKFSYTMNIKKNFHTCIYKVRTNGVI